MLQLEPLGIELQETIEALEKQRAANAALVDGLLWLLVLTLAFQFLRWLRRGAAADE